jgi:hypothetical protein
LVLGLALLLAPIPSYAISVPLPITQATLNLSVSRGSRKQQSCSKSYTSSVG